MSEEDKNQAESPEVQETEDNQEQQQVESSPEPETQAEAEADLTPQEVSQEGMPEEEEQQMDNGQEDEDLQQMQEQQEVTETYDQQQDDGQDQFQEQEPMQHEEMLEPLEQYEGQQQHEEYDQEQMDEQMQHQQQYQQEGMQIEAQNVYEYEHAQIDHEEFGHEMGGNEEMYEQQMQMLTPAQQMQLLVQDIERNMEEQSVQLWSDPEFLPDDSALYIDPLNPPEYAQDEPIVEWKRPHEMTQDDPKMIADGIEPADIKQGILGDCWLLGSFMTLAMHPQLLKNLIVIDKISKGFAVFQFFKNGEWKYVIVDTKIPYSTNRKTPLYAHSSKSQEMWVPLIEKAYAKLHGNYEVLNGGSMAVGMVDVSGGVSEKYNLTTPEMQASIENGTFFRELMRYLQQGYIVGASNSVKDEDGKQQEGSGNQGIRYNHAYGIERIEDIKDQHLQLLRVRNPWGSGTGSEWTGAFADEDENWDAFKNLRDRLNYSFKNDGNWWMQWSDWIANYNRVYVCKLFPSNWSQFSIHGEWQGNSAGGPYPIQADRDEEVKEGHSKLDTNDRWFNNPQYRLTVTKKTQVIISLMQEDESTGNKRPYIPVNFMLVRVKSRRDRLYEVDQDDIVLQAAEGGQRFAQREITKTVFLLPTHEKKNIHYIIVPNTEGEGQRLIERPFFLRVFTSEPVDLVQLPNTIEQVFTSSWTEGTNGGKRVLENGKDNQLWCRNPQYFMNLTKPTHLKIILRKKGARRNRLGKVGVTITKAHAPTTAPPSEMVGKGKKERGMKIASSLAYQNGGISYSDTLHTTSKKEKGTDKIPEFETPRLEAMERKLQILPNEWFQESYYMSEDYAAMYAYYQPTQGPFIIIPSNSETSVTPEFDLKVFSSQPVEICMLEEERHKVKAGQWKDRGAGGCHLYEKEFEPKADNCTWMFNPKYMLKLACREPTEVKITLSRPEKIWKKAIGANLVGCMIGFYVYPGREPPNQDNIRNKDQLQFVPWNEIAQLITLDSHPDGYLIMPATYESNIMGPFILSVSCDCDFTLEEQQ